MSAFRSIMGVAVRIALAVLVVALILMFARDAWQSISNPEIEKRQWDSVQKDIVSAGAWLNAEVEKTERRYKVLQLSKADRITARLSQVSREIQDSASEPSLADRTYLGLVRLAAGGQLLKAVQADLKLKLLEQERQALITLKSFVDAATNYNGTRSEVERLRQEHVKAHELVEANKRARWGIATQNPNTYRIPGAPAYSDIERLRADWRQLNAASWAAYRAWEEKSRAFRFLPDPGAVPTFQVESRSLRSVLDSLQSEVNRIKAMPVAQPSRWREVLWSALGVVFAALLSGVAFKAVLYFLVAPWAARRPPIYLLPGNPSQYGEASRGQPLAHRSSTAVSIVLTIDARSELLVKGDFLQSAPVSSRTTTKLMLNGHYPFASLASGMCLLTRVLPSAEESVVISATKDGLSEIASIALVEGEAIVLQPQHLVGVLHPRNAPVHIASVWRLSSLHAWLTLQFRYLVFHGPATLVVKGCRGVRVEMAHPARTISQAATIGFSADLGYSTRRSPTFIAYLLGQKALFDDSFAGPNGFFAYQEIPSTEQRSGIVERTLQGVIDGVLKAFGV